VDSISVVPLYLKSDGIGDYFADHKEEIDHITGTTLIIHLAKSVLIGDSSDVTKAFGSQRFPGLRRSDFPGLWIEKGGKHFKIRLPRDKNQINDLLRTLTDEAEAAQNIDDLEDRMQKKLSQTPSWMPKAGFAAGILTFFFLVVIVVLAIANYPVPEGGKWALTAALALGLSLAASFIGGTATGDGKLRIPFLDTPLKFSVAGGPAIFVIALLLCYWTYIRA
jgi:hypothetical protein